MKLGAYDTSEYPYCYYDTLSFEYNPYKFLDGEIKWRYCVVGNIIPTHVDEDGILRYGTRAFPGGRKVYLSKSFWPEKGTIKAVGLNRYMSKYTAEGISLDLITNIRRSRVYSKRPLEIMSYLDLSPTWWGNTVYEKQRAEEFAAALREFQEWRKNEHGTELYDAAVRY